MNSSGGEVSQGEVWLVTYLAIVTLGFALLLVTRYLIRVRSNRSRKEESTQRVAEAQRTERRFDEAVKQDVLGPKPRPVVDSRTREQFLAQMRKDYPPASYPKVDVVRPANEKSVASDFRMSSYKYTKRKYLMTYTERKFYAQLHHMFKSRYLIFPQIHLANLLNYHHAGQSFKGAWASIRHFSVDYVVCDPSLRILCAIELDDASHNNPSRRVRDRAVNQLCSGSGLPLVRIPVDDMHDHDYVEHEISHAITL